MKTDLEIFKPFVKKNKFARRIDGLNSIVYTRVSSKEQAKGFSLETQKRVIEENCEKMKLNVVAYFGGTYESAATDERKEFDRMLKFAQQSKVKISCIVVYSHDRFSRSGANAIYIASELRKQNIRIIAVTQPTDTSTSTGIMQQNLQFIFSQYDNDLRKEKCMAGLKEMLLNGYWPLKAPLGYDKITRKKRENVGLEERQKITVNETGKLIRKAFYWKAVDKLTNAEIMYRLKNAGINMYKQKLTKILNNPFYCGIISHNLLNGQLIEGKQEKLVPMDIFLLANNGKGANVTWKLDKDFSEVPLKHFLKCGECGSSFCGYQVKKKGLWYYKCNKTGCKCNRSAKTLNELFAEKLNSYTLMSKYIDPVKEEFFKYFNESEKESLNHSSILKGRLTEIAGKMEKLEERFVIGEIDNELYQKFLSKYRKEKSEIELELDGMRFRNSNLENRLEKYCQILCNLNVLWTSNGYKGKLELQELMFPNGISYDREKSDFRTPEINEVAFVMSDIARDLEEKEKGTYDFNDQKSLLVPPSRPNMNDILEDTRDLARIWDMYGYLVKDRLQDINLKKYANRQIN